MHPSLSPHEMQCRDPAVFLDRGEDIFLTTEIGCILDAGESRGVWVTAGPHLAMGPEESKAHLMLCSCASAVLCSKKLLHRVT